MSPLLLEILVSFAVEKKQQQKQKLKLWNIYFTRAKFTSARGYNYKDLKLINQFFSVKTEAEVSRRYNLQDKVSSFLDQMTK